MPKIITFSKEARTKIAKGVNTIADAVETTLGPRGNNVLIEKKYGAPHSTKDGVTVAKEITLEDPTENAAAQLVKEAATKANDEAGDGTTTATLLARAMYNAAMKSVAVGSSPIEITRGMEIATRCVVKEIYARAKPVENHDDILKVATTSANNDPAIGKLIADATEKVGGNGIITVGEAKGTESEVEVTQGMQFDRGYTSPYFVTNKERMEATFENAHILLVDKKISSLKDLLPILEAIGQSGKSLIIIADDVEGEALAALILNKLRGVLNTCVVKAPGFGDNKKAQLEDIAILTGGIVISEDKGYKLENAIIDHLGNAETITVSKERTTIVNGRGSKQTVQARVAELHTHLENSDSDYDREKYQERIAKLDAGVARIQVGGYTETERKESKDRVQDALRSTQASQESGTVTGGGVTYLRVAKTLENPNALPLENEEQRIGANIIKSSLAAPLTCMLRNALGTQEAYPIFHKVLEGEGSYGYNIRTDAFGNLDKQGVLDAAKVAATALQSASSIAGMLLLTDCVITDKPEQEKAAPANPGMGGMGGMM